MREIFGSAYVEELLEGSIELFNGLVGHPLDTVESVFVNANVAITCSMGCFKFLILAGETFSVLSTILSIKKEKLS